MSFLKFILYFALAYILMRYALRLMYPPKPKQDSRPNQGRNTQSAANLEKPTITIEAESVDYEIIEEPEKKDEK